MQHLLPLFPRPRSLISLCNWVFTPLFTSCIVCDSYSSPRNLYGILHSWERREPKKTSWSPGLQEGRDETKSKRLSWDSGISCRSRKKRVKHAESFMLWVFFLIRTVSFFPCILLASSCMRKNVGDEDAVWTLFSFLQLLQSLFLVSVVQTHLSFPLDFFSLIFKTKCSCFVLNISSSVTFTLQESKGRDNFLLFFLHQRNKWS